MYTSSILATSDDDLTCLQVDMVPWDSFWRVLKSFLGIQPSADPLKIRNFLGSVFRL